MDKTKQKKPRVRFLQKPRWQQLLIVFGWGIGLGIAALAALILTLTVTEYKPAAKETLEITKASSQTEATLKPGSTLSVMTWNLGYGALGDNADFFMDGGQSVYTATEDRVNENLSAIQSEVQSENPDIALLQEVDRDSARSYNLDEMAKLQNDLPAYNSTFAYNFRCKYIPYPMPAIGKVNSGILTMSKYALADSTRIALPCPFKWPVRIGNLKRCLDISTINLEGTEKKLILVNLHLEAYDSGEGKAAQTKMLKEYLQKEVDAGNYVIAGGDFNQIFSNVDASAYPTQEDKWTPGEIAVNDFGEDFQLLMDNSAPSCRSLDQPLEGADTTDFQYYIIDGFIVSKNVKVNQMKTKDLSFKNSDHNPVVMNVTLLDESKN